MGHNELGLENKRHENRRFGKYLRGIREQRRLSLDTVEEMSLSYRERVTKSHLSRIENGQAIPTFPRMFTLSQIYGVPVSSLAERFEVALIRDLVSDDLRDKSEEELQAESRKLRVAGQFREALQVFETLTERWSESGNGTHAQFVDLKLNRINCLTHLSRYISAKEECENLLTDSELTAEQRVKTLHYFVMCCYRLGKFPIAIMALEQSKLEMKHLPDSHPLHAHFAGIGGNIMALTCRHEEAVEAYRDAIKKFDELGAPFEVCRFRFNLASALIELDKIAEARRLLRRVQEESRAKGYERQLALALSSLAMLALRDGNLELAESHCLQSNQIARPREYFSVVFRNCFYLWKMAKERGDEAGRRSNERTLRSYLNRVEDYLPEAEEFRMYLTGGGK